MDLVGFIIRILNTAFKGGECIMKTAYKNWMYPLLAYSLWHFNGYVLLWLFFSSEVTKWTDVL